MLGQRLRHRVTIQHEVETTSVDGEPTGKVWLDLYSDVPAEMVPVSGNQFMSANAEQREVTTRCALRQFPTELDASMRLIHECCDGLAHDIVAVLPDPTYSQHLNLMLKAGVRYVGAAEVDEIDGGNAESIEDSFVGGGGA